jgi:hypothetical protein
MDAHRNVNRYVMEGDDRIAQFVGDRKWRDAWDATVREDPTAKFGTFLLSHYDIQMKLMGYPHGGRDDAATVYKVGRQRLYHLAFYSRHPRGLDFWKKAQKSSDDQTMLFSV